MATPFNIAFGLAAIAVAVLLVYFVVTGSGKDDGLTAGSSRSYCCGSGKFGRSMQWLVAGDGGPVDRWPSPKSALPGGKMVKIGSSTGSSHFPNQFWMDDVAMESCNTCDGSRDGEALLSSQDLIYGDDYGRSHCPYSMSASKLGTGCGPCNSDLQGLAEIS